MGAFLWDDKDQDQWTEITQFMVDQMNRWILVQSGFIGLFDLPWSQRSRIPDPDPDHPKGTHPLIHAVSFDGDSNISNSLIIHKESSKEINV